MPRGVNIDDTIARENVLHVSDEDLVYITDYAVSKNVIADLALAALIETSRSRRAALAKWSDNHPREIKPRAPRAPKPPKEPKAPRAKRAKGAKAITDGAEAPTEEAAGEGTPEALQKPAKASRAPKAPKVPRTTESAAKGPSRGSKGPKPKKVVKPEKKVRAKSGKTKATKKIAGKGGKKKGRHEEEVLQTPEEQGEDYPRVGHDADDGDVDDDAVEQETIEDEEESE